MKIVSTIFCFSLLFVSMSAMASGEEGPFDITSPTCVGCLQHIVAINKGIFKKTKYIPKPVAVFNCNHIMHNECISRPRARRSTPINCISCDASNMLILIKDCKDDPYSVINALCENSHAQ